MRSATRKEIFLFTMMGQALLNIQVLEECLSLSITLKADVGYPPKISKTEADLRLKNRLSKTLGKAVNEAAEKKLYVENLEAALKAFLKERNWFTHQIVNDFYNPHKQDIVLIRIKAIALEAHRLQRMIEDDLITYAESNELDMSSVRAAIKQWEYGFESTKSLEDRL